ncbi:MAG: methyltransferase domain-containing protein [bacterium]|nr:methyltransferase domain-containing protein [bacterium]
MAGLLIGTSACSNTTATPPSAVSPIPAASPAKTGAAGGVSVSRRSALPLPAVSQIKQEAQLIKTLRDFIAKMSASSQASGVSPDNGLKTIEETLEASAKVLRDREAAHSLYMYKYALRYLVERALFLDPQADQGQRAAAFFTKGQGRWVAFMPEWEFEPLAEANYAILYGGGNVNVRGPEGQEETVPNPLWSTQVLLAVREGDLGKMKQLHEAATLLEYPRWPLEPYRQLFTSVSVQREQQLWDNLAKVIGEKPGKGASWADVGFGAGQLFSVLRRELGSEAKIYGVDDDENCIVLATLAERSGKADWGAVELLTAAGNSLGLPEKSLDFVHLSGVYMAGISKEQFSDTVQPLWSSLRQALKPDGLLIIDADPDTWVQMRSSLKAAGFKEKSVYEYPEARQEGLPSVYAAFSL